MRKKAKYRNHLSVYDVSAEAFQASPVNISQYDTSVFAPVALDTTSELAKRQEEWLRQEAEKEKERKQKENEEIAKRKKRNIIIFMVGFSLVFIFVLSERRT
jgi:tRNA A37 N6-isopentenylltransferase MiaA